jgi:hypothetical protein
MKEQENVNIDEDMELQHELEQEEIYQNMRLKCEVEFGMLSQERYDKIMEEKKGKQ